MAVADRPAAAGGQPGYLAQAWRSFRWALWLGWANESNWTDPWLFFIYALAKPLAGALTVVVMFTVVSGAELGSPMFNYLFLGSAFFQYVYQTSSGMAFVVLDDREWNRTLKYIWMSPAHFGWYFIGRGMAKVLIASLSVAILILVGWLFLGVRLSLEAWGYGVLVFGLGLVACVAIGLILSGSLLLLSNQGDYVSEGVGGLLYLLAGAVFPIDVLPAWVQPLSLGLPHTFWMEGIRRGWVGGPSLSPYLGQFSDSEVLWRLVGLTVIWTLVATLWFWLCQRWTAHLGYIDRTTAH